ncbi:MAG: hypothetical protein HYZ23_00280 [Chloroflexi bacterium]|nr:hypothetical protein [Chloroflexota bacterium]
MSNIPRIMRTFGWLIFALMWIPFVFIFFTMPNGSYTGQELMALGWKTLLPLALTIGMSIVSMSLIMGSSIVGWLMGRLVLARGETGTARILNIQPTGMRVNSYYYGMRFTLEVQSFGETFKADTERLVPMHDMTKYQPGMTVNVKYDPLTKLVAMTD